MKKFMIALCLALVALVSGCNSQDVGASHPTSTTTERSVPPTAEVPQNPTTTRDTAPAVTPTESESKVETTADGELVLHRVKNALPEWVDEEESRWIPATGLFSSAECKSSFGPYGIPAGSMGTTEDPAWPGASYYIAKDGVHISFADRIPRGLITYNMDGKFTMTIAFDFRPDFHDYFLSQEELGDVNLGMPAWQVSIGSVCGFR